MVVNTNAFFMVAGAEGFPVFNICLVVMVYLAAMMT
jgi:hypothetical protein